MSDIWMTAEEIRERMLRDWRDGWPESDRLWAVRDGVERVCKYLAALEREHAELLARVERLEKERDDGR